MDRNSQSDGGPEDTRKFSHAAKCDGRVWSAWDEHRRCHSELHDRLNDDPLLEEISEFLNAHLLSKDWQTRAFEEKFDAFIHQAALKARPK